MSLLLKAQVVLPGTAVGHLAACRQEAKVVRCRVVVIPMGPTVVVAVLFQVRKENALARE